MQIKRRNKIHKSKLKPCYPGDKIPKKNLKNKKTIVSLNNIIDEKKSQASYHNSPPV